MWTVVGLAGVTCGGKTTLANGLVETLDSSDTTVVSLDNYFLPKQDPRHLWLPQLKLINWEVINSIDVERLMKDIMDILSGEGDNQVLLIDGHTCLNIPQVAELCHLKYFFTLNQNECFERRQAKPYDKPDKPGYFEHAVWPSYQAHRREVEEGYLDVTLLSGTAARGELVATVRADILGVQTCGGAA